MAAHKPSSALSESCGSSSVDIDGASAEPCNKRQGWGLNREFGEASDNDEEEDSDWNPFRRRLHMILRSTATDVVLGFIIALSLVVVIVETDATVDGDEAPETIQMMNVGFTVLYAIELAVRLYVYRVTFFFHWFNVMDFKIVMVDILLKLFQQSSMVSTLRIFRLAKLGRVLVLLVKFPELHMILRGIYCTIKSVFWGMCLLTIVILTWSILAVQLIHPLNKDIDYGECERCNRAFAGVFSSFVTIFQTVVAGDSWGQVAVPIIERCPATLAYFGPVFVSISLLVLNLILATTVERAAQAKDEDQAELNARRLEEKKKAYKVAEKRLKALCKAMDVDGSGALTLEEMEDGYKSNPEFHQEMKAMDIKSDDMQTVFKVLDIDGSGDVNYEEFVESLHMMKTRDSHTLLMFTHQLVEDVLAKSSAELELLTSKKNGLVKHISDEVTRKTLRVLGPFLETSTNKLPMQGWELGERDTQDDEAPFASWSSAVLPPMEESQGPDRHKCCKEVQSVSHEFPRHEGKREQPRVQNSRSDAAPPPVPVTSLIEIETPHIGGRKASLDLDGDGSASHSQNHQGKLGGINPESSSFAAYCRREGNLKDEESPPHDIAIERARDARDRKARRHFGDRMEKRGVETRRKIISQMEDIDMVPHQLTQITTSVQSIERAIYFMGGAGKHALWCPCCPPNCGDARGNMHSTI